MEIKTLLTFDDIAGSFEAFLELRLELFDRQSFTEQVMKQQKEGYHVIAIIDDGEIVSCVGFRIMTTLAFGKTLYIDDLITKEKHRKKGYAQALLNHIKDVAKDKNCQEIHLDSGYTRHRAHKVYLQEGFEFCCHHLSLKIK